MCRSGVQAPFRLIGRAPLGQVGEIRSKGRQCIDGAPFGPQRASEFRGRRSARRVPVSVNRKLKIWYTMKYQYQIGIWYSCPKFLGIFLVFYWCHEYDLYQIWLNIGIFSEE